MATKSSTTRCGSMRVQKMPTRTGTGMARTGLRCSVCQRCHESTSGSASTHSRKLSKWWMRVEAESSSGLKSHGEMAVPATKRSSGTR